jgi:hypothetical protein
MNNSFEDSNTLLDEFHSEGVQALQKYFSIVKKGITELINKVDRY